MSGLITGLAYFVFAAAAILATRLSGGLALMWIANAVLLTAFLLTPHRLWIIPAVGTFIASLAASITVSPVPEAAFFFASANVAEAWIVAEILRHSNIRRDPFDSARAVFIFIVSAGIIGPAISGFIGAATASAAFGRSFVGSWLDWFAGHGLGTIMATPLILLPFLGDSLLRKQTTAAKVRAAGLLLLVTVTALGVFSQNDYPLLFLPLLPVLMATFVLGRSGAAASVAIVAVIAGVQTALNSGPLSLMHTEDAVRFQFLQFYIAFQFAIALPVAAILRQRDTLTEHIQDHAAALQLLLDNTSDVLLNLDIEGRIRLASESVREVAGYEPEELIGKNALSLVDGPWVERVRAVHLEALEEPNKTFTVEYRARRANGELAWFETRTRVIRRADGTTAGVVSAIREVGHRKSIEERLMEAAQTDALTSVLNRRGFLQKLNIALTDKVGPVKPTTIAMVDIDFFKRINDQYGHAAGDLALSRVASILKAEVRVGDIVGRIGGEEFAIALVEADLNDAATVCERLRAEIEQNHIPIAPGKSIQLTASFGLAALVPGPAGAIEAALENADSALYAAKHNGRNCLQIAA
ncbi:sensor domain-containing diguanylate cyclase [Sphingosinicella microcystinivorans]|uniref:diguanylate cyclase n=1 Tax=Sphingosinicella microcystinivorans TaxID=335406 RepID=A0AAD1D7U0_SPHMI|nr:sensor domain-containing diguanylate cyclase [Sphingosinicella microcystinivorans]BBE35240.1 hypothetical protein SmB9_28980 [Sphingosinicella microcystinivorans]